MIIEVDSRSALLSSLVATLGVIDVYRDGLRTTHNANLKFPKYMD